MSISAVLIKKLFIVGTTRGLQAYQVIEADGKVFLNTIWEPLALAREPSDFEVTSDRNLVFVSHLEGSITTVLFNHSASMKQLTSYNTKGLGTTSVAVDKQMRFVLATNYDSGSGVVFKLIENDKLELFNLLQYEDPSNVVKERQNASHPSCFTLDPKEKFAYVTDLGGDTLIQYEFHSSKGPQPDSAKFLPLNPGCGPSQIAFHPDYHTLYVSCELSNEIVVVSLEESNMR